MYCRICGSVVSNEFYCTKCDRIMNSSELVRNPIPKDKINGIALKNTDNENIDTVGNQAEHKVYEAVKIINTEKTIETSQINVSQDLSVLETEQVDKNKRKTKILPKLLAVLILAGLIIFGYFYLYKGILPWKLITKPATEVSTEDTSEVSSESSVVISSEYYDVDE